MGGQAVGVRGWVAVAGAWGAALLMIMSLPRTRSLQRNTSTPRTHRELARSATSWRITRAPVGMPASKQARNLKLVGSV